ncbi:heme-degrading domain-containing protein [Rhizobium sp. SG2393]|uniref:heme-degrading domain-containing protein n=1 Tax=Rhizobium sp. SG2393 TaxID=3276279 RepID=UPI003672FFEE
MAVDEDLAKIAEQEAELVFDSFDPHVAFALGTLTRDLAIERKLGIVVDVTLFSMPLFYAALPGSLPDNFNWVRRKRNTVFRFLRASYATGMMLSKQQVTLAGKFGLLEVDYAAHGGSFPIVVKGAGCIGALTVSGLPQREDHQLAVEALSHQLGKDFASLRLA